MKALLTTVLFLGALISAFAQTREIYTNPNFKNLAKDHKVLAILPFKTTCGCCSARKTGRPGRTKCRSFLLSEAEGKQRYLC